VRYRKGLPESDVTVHCGPSDAEARSRLLFTITPCRHSAGRAHNGQTTKWLGLNSQVKADAVALVTKGGKSLRTVAKQLGLADGSIRLWVDQSTEQVSSGLMVDERAELMKLRKRLKRVEMERDILKKTAFFARESA
jgi:transposase